MCAGRSVRAAAAARRIPDGVPIAPCSAGALLAPVRAPHVPANLLSDAATQPANVWCFYHNQDAVKGCHPFRCVSHLAGPAAGERAVGVAAQRPRRAARAAAQRLQRSAAAQQRAPALAGQPSVPAPAGLWLRGRQPGTRACPNTACVPACAPPHARLILTRPTHRPRPRRARPAVLCAHRRAFPAAHQQSMEV